MKCKTCVIGLRVRWLHNADMLKLQEKQADYAKKEKAHENRIKMQMNLKKLSSQAQERLDELQNEVIVSEPQILQQSPATNKSKKFSVR